jgi:hypothetical protein
MCKNGHRPQGPTDIFFLSSLLHQRASRGECSEALIRPDDASLTIIIIVIIIIIIMTWMVVS